MRPRTILAAATVVVAVVASVLGAQLATGDDEHAGIEVPVGRPGQAAPTTTTTVPAPTFRIDGTEILRDGEPFVPVGANVLGPDAFFNVHGQSAGHARFLRDVWRFNTVRLNSCLPEGCGYGVHNERNDDLDGLVDEYTDAGLVTIIALHQVRPGLWPDDGQLDAIEAWWRDVARRFAGREDVWFNLLNEPGSDRPAPTRWLELHTRLVRAIRAEGANNIIVVDGTQWGQEAGTREPRMVREADSAVLTHGPALHAIDDQVLFSFHVYDQWGPPEVDDAARDARLADYIDRVHDKGLPLLIGEVGGHVEPCCEREALGAAAAYRVAPGKGVGLLAWHVQGEDHHRLIATTADVTAPEMLDDARNPTNLTWMGRLLWDLAHR